MAAGIEESARNSSTCAPATAADLGSTTLILKSAAEAAASRAKTETKILKNRIALLLCHAQGVAGDGSRRSPGLRVRTMWTGASPSPSRGISHLPGRAGLGRASVR